MKTLNFELVDKVFSYSNLPKLRLATKTDIMRWNIHLHIFRIQNMFSPNGVGCVLRGRCPRSLTLSAARSAYLAGNKNNHTHDQSKQLG